MKNTKIITIIFDNLKHEVVDAYIGTSYKDKLNELNCKTSLTCKLNCEDIDRYSIITEKVNINCTSIYVCIVNNNYKFMSESLTSCKNYLSNELDNNFIQKVVIDKNAYKNACYKDLTDKRYFEVLIEDEACVNFLADKWLIDNFELIDNELTENFKTTFAIKVNKTIIEL